MTTFALDSSAVLAWILQERGRWKLVDAVLNEADADPVLPGPVLTEVIVTARRRGNTSSAQHISDTLTAIGMRVEPAHDADLLRAAEARVNGRKNDAFPWRCIDFGCHRTSRREDPDEGPLLDAVCSQRPHSGRNCSDLSHLDARVSAIQQLRQTSTSHPAG